MRDKAQPHKLITYTPDKCQSISHCSPTHALVCASSDAWGHLRGRQRIRKRTRWHSHTPNLCTFLRIFVHKSAVLTLWLSPAHIPWSQASEDTQPTGLPRTMRSLMVNNSSSKFTSNTAWCADMDLSRMTTSLSFSSRPIRFSPSRRTNRCPPNTLTSTAVCHRERTKHNTITRGDPTPLHEPPHLLRTCRAITAIAIILTKVHLHKLGRHGGGSTQHNRLTARFGREFPPGLFFYMVVFIM